MRAATAYELMRSERDKYQQEAAELHIENERLKAQFARMAAPVSRQEKARAGIGGLCVLTLNAIIADRAKAPPAQ